MSSVLCNPIALTDLDCFVSLTGLQIQLKYNNEQEIWQYCRGKYQRLRKYDPWQLNFPLFKSSDYLAQYWFVCPSQETECKLLLSHCRNITKHCQRNNGTKIFLLNRKSQNAMQGPWSLEVCIEGEIESAVWKMQELVAAQKSSQSWYRILRSLPNGSQVFQNIKKWSFLSSSSRKMSDWFLWLVTQVVYLTRHAMIK